MAAGGCGEDGQLGLFLLGVKLAGSLARQPAASKEEEEEGEKEQVSRPHHGV